MSGLDHVTPLADGITRIVLPLPFPSPSSVNCYLFEGTEGFTLLDCGVDGHVGYDALRAALTGLGLAVPDIHRVIASHLHVDHMGLAHRLVADAGAQWVLHRSAEAEIDHYNDWSYRQERLARFAEVHGAPPDVVTLLRQEFPRPGWYGYALPPTHRVEHGDRIPLEDGRHLEVLYTPGHQPNHISLRDDRTGLFFSGDHILPRITPFVPFTGEEDDHLGDYLRSLEVVETLDPGPTHPGHGPTIPRGGARARQIRLHHERRMNRILDAIGSEERTAWQVMTEVFRPGLSLMEQRLAIQETLAHLEHLRRVGRVERHRDGDVWRYRRTGR